MSTNFYSNGIHIGKRYFAGSGRMGFIWAIEPGRLMSEFSTFEDEAGTCYTFEEMMEVLTQIRINKYNHIGEEFS